MERIGIRELRGSAAATIRRAGAGERIIVTVDGRPIAQLGPLEPAAGEPTIDDLAARGLIVRSRRDDRPPPELEVPMWAGTRLDRLLVEVRGR
jgi:antitoxin (DNA-binding transcriptional repressor) of toxin-antitoxin stability system